VLQAFPPLNTALKIGAAAYMIYLAWKIAFSASFGDADAPPRPFTFFQAVGFQWINPKGWTMALVAMAAYVTTDHPVLSVVLVATAFAAVMLPSIATWITFGVALRGLLRDPTRLKIFNVAMGLMLVATIWPMLSTA
jgi:threonine/homoserine/homoserine lactone efflux protein